MLPAPGKNERSQPRQTVGRPEISRHARKALFPMDCRFNAQLYRMAHIAGFTLVRSGEA